MTTRIITQPLSRSELTEVAKERFGDMVKAVVDIEQEMMAIGGELHADEEALLLEKGSEQAHLWGINLYPDETGEAFIEFDSMINIRPGQGNRTRGVEDASIRDRVQSVVSKLVQS